MTDDDVAKALADVRQDEAPPAESEQQILTALQATGLLGPRRRPLRTGLLIAASIAASLVVGVWIGMGYRRPSSDQTRFLLLLYEDANFDGQKGDRRALEAEYHAWFLKLVETGHAISGDKLDWGGAELRPHEPARAIPAVPADDAADGFFVIVASDEQAAIGVAETCPHVRHGGRIVVRPIGK